MKRAIIILISAILTLTACVPTPDECMAVIYALMSAYTLVLVMLMLYMSVRFSKSAGVISAFGSSLYGYLLTPDFVKTVFGIPEDRMYRANLILGWISPLNHASYHMHNFGYDRLPTFFELCYYDRDMRSFVFALASRDKTL